MVNADIGMNAGNIWHLLYEKGKLSLKEIREFTKYQESLIHSALGWLSKEDKIVISNRNGTIYVELKKSGPTSDIYY